jgi:hypothetical protein
MAVEFLLGQELSFWGKYILQMEKIRNPEGMRVCRDSRKK